MFRFEPFLAHWRGLELGPLLVIKSRIRAPARLENEMAQSRREFIKIGGAGVAVAAAGTGLATQWWGLDPDVVHDPSTDGDRVVPTFCELCFWKCGLLAHVRNG